MLCLQGVCTEDLSMLRAYNVLYGADLDWSPKKTFNAPI